RRGAGFAMLTVRTKEAEASLALAIEQSAARFDRTLGMDGAYEHSGRMAMCAYLDQWWTTVMCSAPPVQLGVGDEYFSRKTVAAITEGRGDMRPDLTGPIADTRQPFERRQLA